MFFINYKKTAGFTLVEILIVMVIMGLVMTSVYSLYISTQRTANTSEEVSDVQQNLRIALDTLVSDIRMAGFLVPDQPAVLIAPDAVFVDTNRNGAIDTGEVGNFLQITSRSSDMSYARVTSEELGASKGIRVVEAMAPNFRDENEIIIVRPTSGNVVAGPFEIGEPTGDLLPISSYAASGVREGDIIVRKSDLNIATISYWIRPVDGGGDNNFELMRGDGTATTIIATNINDIDFTYILDDGTEVNTTTEIDRINSIRITLTGETDNTRTGLANFSGVKSRALQTVATLRNAFGD